MSNNSNLMNAERNIKKVRRMKSYLIQHREQDPAYTERVLRSYSKVVKISLTYTLLCVAAIAVAVSVGMMKLSEYPTSFTRTGHVDGSKIWYIQNTKHELALSDYGYDATEYKDGDRFVVLLDNNENVVKIAEAKEQMKSQTTGAILMVGGLIGMIVIIILCYLIGTKTYGKEWYDYTKWYARNIGY